jgi:hypothetical protein
MYNWASARRCGGTEPSGGPRSNKTIVRADLSVVGEVRAQVVADAAGRTLERYVYRHVLFGASVYSELARGTRG